LLPEAREEEEEGRLGLASGYCQLYRSEKLGVLLHSGAAVIAVILLHISGRVLFWADLEPGQGPAPHPTSKTALTHQSSPHSKRVPMGPSVSARTSY
jgi:hypothetical protein